MNNVIYEQIYDLDKTGISIRYYTQRGEYTPPHWHSALELHYALNGTGEIFFSGKSVMRWSAVNSAGGFQCDPHTQCARVSMGVSIYVSREFLKKYVPDLDVCHLECSRETLEREKLDSYLKSAR